MVTVNVSEFERFETIWFFRFFVCSRQQTFYVIYSFTYDRLA